MEAGKTTEGRIALANGVMIPKIGFGTFDLENGKQAEDAVKAAIEIGYRLIDCARFYGNEKSVGNALADVDVPREELFITSKVWNDRQLDGTVRESVEESLRDLQVDYLDLLLIHWPVEGHFLDTWKMFIEMRDEGLVRSIGVSNHTIPQLDLLIEQTGEVPSVNQIELHPYLQNAEMLAFCARNGIAVEAWSPLGRGGCLDDPVIASIAQQHDASPAQIILAWHMIKGVIPLPRSKNPGRMRENFESQSIRLSDAEVEEIDALNADAPVIAGIDPQGFAEHLNGLSSHF